MGTVIVEWATQCFPCIDTCSAIETIREVTTTSSTNTSVPRYLLQHPPERTLKRKLVGFLHDALPCLFKLENNEHYKGLL
jgi:hypothetical protein